MTGLHYSLYDLNIMANLLNLRFLLPRNLCSTKDVYIFAIVYERQRCLVLIYL